MITYPALNWLAIVLAAIATVVVGGLWYAPFAFGKAWVKALGWSEAEQKERAKAAAPGYALAIVGALVNAFVLAVTVRFFGATTAVDAIWVASLMWAGFMAFTQAVGTLFEGRSWSLFGINAANSLVNQLVMALILVAWR